MLVPVLLTLFVCLPLALAATIGLSRTRTGQTLGLVPWVPKKTLGWMLGKGVPQPGRLSEHDWLHFERLLKGHSVPAAAQEPGHGQRSSSSFEHMSTDELVDELASTVNRPSTPAVAQHYDALGRFAKVGIVVALATIALGMYGLVTSGGSGGAMSAALAGSITSRVALNTATQADIDRTTVTVTSADLPDVIKRAAGIGVAIQCDGGVSMGTGPALAPSSEAEDWTTCTGKLGNYQLSVVPAGAEAVQVVVEPIAKDPIQSL